MKKIFISIINYNNRKDTLACLESINSLKIEDINLEVVLVDNNSKERLGIENGQFKNINLNLIFSEKNLGFSGGHNLGIKHALSKDADYVIVLNNDVILDINLIDQLVKTAEREDVGIVSPKIYFAKGFEFHKDKYKKEELGKVIWYAGGEMDWNNLIGKHKGVDKVDKGQFDEEIETDFSSGCCMLIKKEVFEKVGLFDEKYFLYYEDNDFSQRAKKKRFKIIYNPKAILWHKNAGSVGGSGSDIQDYFITRNRLLFGFKYASLKTKAALFRESLRLLSSGRTWQKIGVRDFYLRRFGKGSYNLN